MKPPELQQRLRGVLAFTPTPFTPDDRVDLDGLARHVDFLCGTGAGAVVVCGGVGEFFALDLDEYRAAISAAAQAARGRVPVIAGIGHVTRIATRLAEHAASAGIAGLMIHPQYFITPPEAGIVEHYRAIGRASGLGLMIYSTEAAAATLDLVRRLAEVEQVVALKDEYGDVALFAQMVRAVGPRLAWINGMAELHTPRYAEAGAQAFTSGIVNIAPAFTMEVWDASARGRRQELEQVLTTKIKPLAELRSRKPGYPIAIIKEAMNMLGRAGGTVRAPLVPIAPEDRADLRRTLVALGLLRA